MPKRETRRSTVVEMTDELRQRWEQSLRETEAERPEIIERGRRLLAAVEEPTLSGSLRRAARDSGFSFDEIVERLGIPAEQYAEFQTGAKALGSDVMDRLAALLRYELVPVQRG